MDLLGESPALSLNDEGWRIYSRHGASSPQFVGEDAKVVNSSVTQGCEIHGTVRNSVIGSGVRIMKGAVVEDSVIFDNVVIGEGAAVRYCMLDSSVTVGKGASVGVARDTACGITVLGNGVSVPEHAVIGDNAMISEWKGE